MKGCFQTSNLNMLEHGARVHWYYLDLIEHIRYGRPLQRTWKLPDWYNDPALWERQYPVGIMNQYHLWHDCGKPFCRTVDSDGRQHFPDHARISEHLFRFAGGQDDAARLIGMDMDIHLLRADGIAEFAVRPEAASLLITGLCEIHANAEMFGGIESTSFKIKWKHINKRGRAILKEIQNA